MPINPVEVHPKSHQKYKWIAILSTLAITVLLSLLLIYEIGEYGNALFILIPFLLGAGPSLIYGFKQKITKAQSYSFGMTAVMLYTLALLLFAIEGLVCIVMALPFLILLGGIGCMIGFELISRSAKFAPPTLLILIAAIPVTGFVEVDGRPVLNQITSSVVIDADPEEVWKQVVEFPLLNPPAEFIFRAGISYPINAEIVGKGVGAVRYCNFNTGSFVEPITVWDQPNLLAFDVLEQPEPMTEISFYDINAPHLHDYFISEKGQFKLTRLPDGKTLLEGTTWYRHDIAPTFYWDIWSKYILHQIHFRVLDHIKNNAELSKKSS